MKGRYIVETVGCNDFHCSGVRFISYWRVFKRKRSIHGQGEHILLGFSLSTILPSQAWIYRLRFHSVITGLNIREESSFGFWSMFGVYSRETISNAVSFSFHFHAYPAPFIILPLISKMKTLFSSFFRHIEVKHWLK